MKVYVTVKSVCDADGYVTPIELQWTDGTAYSIDRVLDVQKAASLKSGGFGLRYRVRLSNEDQNVWSRERYLYYERGLNPERWFVETER